MGILLLISGLLCAGTTCGEQGQAELCAGDCVGPGGPSHAGNAAAVTPEDSQPPYGPDISGAMVELLSASSSATALERIAGARAAALRGFGHPELGAALGQCARLAGDEAAAAIMAIAARGEVDQLPSVRHALRSSNNPAVVAAGCLALAAFRDGHSRSLVMLTLLQQRGGLYGAAACTAALAELHDRVPGKFLTFTWNFLSNKPYRQMVGAVARKSASASGRRRIAQEALVTLERTVGVSDPTPDELQALLLAACTLQDSGDSSKAATEKSVDQALRCLPPTSPVREALCCKAAALCQAAYAGCGAPKPGCSGSTTYRNWTHIGNLSNSLPIKGPFTGNPQYWDDILRNSPALRALGASPEQIEAVVAKTRDFRGALAHRWSPDSLAEMKTSKKPKPQRAGHFKAKVKPNSYPQEFLTYAPELKRPEWLAPGVYLTVDDGPSLSNLPRILDSLDGHHAKAMFFFIGVNIITHFTNHPELTRKLLQRVIDSGNLVGYHTMEHALTWPNHIVYWAPDQLADDVELFRMVVKLASERNVDIVYGRAPGGTGTRSNALRDAFLAAGLRSPVGWTAEFRSNAARSDVESAAYSIAEKDHVSIILMHEYHSTPSVIDLFLTKHRKATEARSKRRGDQDKAASQ